MPFSSPPLSSLEGNLGTSVAVQWLRLRLQIQGLQVRSLAGKLRSYMPRGQKKKKTRNNIVTNSINTLKWSTSK